VVSIDYAGVTDTKALKVSPVVGERREGATDLCVEDTVNAGGFLGLGGG